MDYFDVVPDKRAKGLCCVKGCRKHVTKRGKSPFCSRCRDRRYKQTKPESYAWDKLKGNAMRRGIPFLLTRKEFSTFCARTGYLEAKGRFADCLSIDRIDYAKGYALGNIRVITCSDNSRKSHVERMLEQKYGRKRQYAVAEPDPWDPDDPF